MRVEPAHAGHLFAMGAALRLSLTAPVYRAIAAQMLLSSSVAAFEDGSHPAPFAIGGVCRLDDGDGEIWLVVRPDIRGPLLLAFLRMARARLAALPRPLIAYIEADNRKGARLARLLGLTETGQWIGTARQWRSVDG